MLCVGCDTLIKGDYMIGVSVVRAQRPIKRPVCIPCWEQPSRRKRALKMHFFRAFDADLAAELAGGSNVGG